jgi:hypothetical protein
VRRWDDHMVAGGRGHGVEASSSRAGRSASGEGRVDGPPAFADAREKQELWGELRDHGAALNRALNEALRIHGGPRVARLPGEALLPILFDFVVFRACSSWRDAHWFWFVGGRSSSTAPAISTEPSTG